MEEQGGNVGWVLICTEQKKRRRENEIWVLDHIDSLRLRPRGLVFAMWGRIASERSGGLGDRRCVVNAIRIVRPRTTGALAVRGRERFFCRREAEVEVRRERQE